MLDQQNQLKKKSLFRQLALTVRDIEEPWVRKNVVSANYTSNTYSTNIGNKLTSYAKQLKRYSEQKHNRLPISAS